MFLEKFRIHSGVMRVARGGSGAKAPPLAARPDALPLLSSECGKQYRDPFSLSSSVLPWGGGIFFLLLCRHTTSPPITSGRLVSFLLLLFCHHTASAPNTSGTHSSVQSHLLHSSVQSHFYSWYFFGFESTQLARQVTAGTHTLRWRCSNMVAWKHLARRHSRNGPWTHKYCFDVDVFVCWEWIEEFEWWLLLRMCLSFFVRFRRPNLIPRLN